MDIVAHIFSGLREHRLDNGVLLLDNNEKRKKQLQTNEVFSEKWTVYSEENIEEQEKLFEFQRLWFLELYGFKDEGTLAKHLESCQYIVDAGCGLGYKAAWLSSLAPHATIIAIDYSEAVYIAQKNYADLYPNIIFARGDIANTFIESDLIDFLVCDQVIMHTENPELTLVELSRILSVTGQLCCYWYKKKALPRELLDDYFRNNVDQFSKQQLWELSEGVLALGKQLSELNIQITVPDIPLLGIKGGKSDLQRFIYWNFLKCFWNPELGHATSLATNFDWYSPSNAQRFHWSEVERQLENAGLETIFFHEENACLTGRFVKA